MKRVVVPEKSKLVEEISEKKRSTMVIKLSPQKKALLDEITRRKKNRVATIIKEWLKKDKPKTER